MTNDIYLTGGNTHLSGQVVLVLGGFVGLHRGSSFLPGERAHLLALMTSRATTPRYIEPLNIKESRRKIALALPKE
jgi:hypothetical protein